MASYKYLIRKRDSRKVTSTRINVVDLLKQTKLEQRRKKRKSIIVATAAISALAVSGLIISL